MNDKKQNDEKPIPESKDMEAPGVMENGKPIPNYEHIGTPHQEMVEEQPRNVDGHTVKK